MNRCYLKLLLQILSRPALALLRYRITETLSTRFSEEHIRFQDVSTLFSFTSNQKPIIIMEMVLLLRDKNLSIDTARRGVKTLLLADHISQS